MQHRMRRMFLVAAFAAIAGAQVLPGSHLDGLSHVDASLLAAPAHASRVLTPPAPSSSFRGTGSCPMCLALSQARTAVSPQAALQGAALDPSAPLLVGRVATAARMAVGLATTGPRAPPTRS